MSKRAYRAKVLAALPGSAAEVRQRTGFGIATISRWLNDLLECNEIYLHHKAVGPNGGKLSEYFYPGPKPAGFVPKIPRMPTNSEREARYRQRLRKSGEWEHVKARKRAQYHADKKPKRDPLMAAFFGGSA